MKIEETKCVVCNCKGRNIFTSQDRFGNEKFNVAKCDNCDLIFVNPRPSIKDIGRYYPKDYYKNAFLQQSSFIRKLIQGMVDKEKLGFVLRYSDKGKKGKLLDVGCGDGRFLDSIKKKFDVYGCDVSETGLKYARDVYGLNNLSLGGLKNINYKDKFDVVTLWTSLEHVHNPLESLREINRLLKNNGVLVLSVPNSASLQFKLFKGKWFHLDVPRHLFIFSMKSMERLCRESGFRIIRMFNNNIQLNPAGWAGSIFGSKNKAVNMIFPLLSAAFLPITLIEGLFFSGGSVTFVLKKS